ncbi:MAG: TrkH family potassium uptake protein [Acidimicrobiales bacterium]|nr:TrkH family potassium uptake protein [Acidimicrobiales bacterium]
MTAAPPATAPSRRLASASLHLSGVALLFVAAGVVVSAGVAAIDGGPDTPGLLWAAAVIGAAGALLRRFTVVPPRVSRTGSFVAVTVAWLVVCGAGALPYLLVGTFTRIDDALFESVSGFTTTGASVLPAVEGNPAGVLFWRQMTHWLGGMGMIVLAVAVLPFLGVGGLELIAAEAPGPSTDRLAPRINQTARRLWGIYVALTGVGVLLLLAAGLSLYDAVGHSFATIATGGFSTYNLGARHFDSVGVDMVLVFGMLAGGTSFTLHWRALRSGPRAYLADGEFRVFVGILAVAGAAVVWLLMADGAAAGTAARNGLFNVVSIMTTTGFTHTDFTVWVAAAQLVLLLLMLVGGMTGSTSGGMKVLRVDVIGRFAVREVRRVRHPRAVIPLRVGSSPVPEATAYRVVGFVLLYLAVGLIAIVLVAATGASLLDAAGGVASTMGSIGPGLGPAGPLGNFLVFDPPARWLLTVLMLLGRLEIVPLLLTVGALARLADGSRVRRWRRSR